MRCTTRQSCSRVVSASDQPKNGSEHMTDDRIAVARREFLKFLAASPYVAAAGGVGAFLRTPAASAQQGPKPPAVITDPAHALSVFDFEEAGAPQGASGPLGVHGQRRGRRRDAAGEPRDLQTRAVAAATAARCDARRHARRSVRHDLRQPDLPVPDRRGAVVLPRGATARSPSRARRRSAARCSASPR